MPPSVAIYKVIDNEKIRRRNFLKKKPDGELLEQLDQPFNQHPTLQKGKRLTAEHALFNWPSWATLGQPLAEAGLMVGFLSAVHSLSLVLFAILDAKEKEGQQLAINLAAITYHISAFIIYTMGVIGSELHNWHLVKAMAVFKTGDIVFGVLIDLITSKGLISDATCLIGISYNLILYGSYQWITWRAFVLACNILGMVALWRQVTLCYLVDKNKIRLEPAESEDETESE